MKSTVARMSVRSVRTMVVAVLGACIPSAAHAEVREIAFADLVTKSDLVVVAKVSKVEDAPADLKPVAEKYGFSELKVATAKVIETWKGNPVREVRYFASPDHMCDTTGAEAGEHVVLFLEKRNVFRRNEPRFMSIAHVGRGRMRLLDVEGKTCAPVWSDVILPKGTPTIAEGKTARVRAQATASDKDAMPREFTLSVKSIELSVLRELVKASAHERTASGK